MGESSSSHLQNSWAFPLYGAASLWVSTATMYAGTMRVRALQATSSFTSPEPNMTEL